MLFVNELETFFYLHTITEYLRSCQLGCCLPSIKVANSTNQHPATQGPFSFLSPIPVLHMIRKLPCHWHFFPPVCALCVTRVCVCLTYHTTHPGVPILPRDATIRSSSQFRSRPCVGSLFPLSRQARLVKVVSKHNISAEWLLDDRPSSKHIYKR